MKDDRRQLRQTLRARRRALSADERATSAHALALNLQRQRLFLSSRRIACYLAVGGEIDTLPLIERAYRLHKRIYLPVLARNSTRIFLRFAAYEPGDRLVTNRFGIPEPDVPARRLVNGSDLDLVLTPLVAFDALGNRLGMGGGYYDRSFHFLHHNTRWQHPHLVGIAYDFQRVPRLKSEAWDVPLHGIITDLEAYFPR